MKKKGPAQEQPTPLDKLVIEFLLSRQAGGVRPRTVDYYDRNMTLLKKYCQDRGITFFEDINASALNGFFVWMKGRGHNEGGIHGAFRCVKTLILWYIRNYEPEGYRNPLNKILSPRRPKQILDPIPLEDIRRLIKSCPADTFAGIRDAAMIRALVDTGARANELLMMDIGDLDYSTGSIHIRFGKGAKTRTVFIGEKTRRAIRRYLRRRGKVEPGEPLWVTVTGGRMTYWGLRDLIEDRAAAAGIKRPSIHAFRRTFAVESLRAGLDPFALPGILGHEDLQITRLYVKLMADDLRKEHNKASPGEKL